jgi:hypothetical protein
LLGFGAHQTKFLSELSLPSIEVKVVIVEDHFVSYSTNDPTYSNDDLSKMSPPKFVLASIIVSRGFKF